MAVSFCSSQLFRRSQWRYLWQLMVLTLLMLFALQGWANIRIDSAGSSEKKIADTIRQSLLGPGVEISNVKLVRYSKSRVGLFSNGGSVPDFDIEKGLVLSTDSVKKLKGSAKKQFNERQVDEERGGESDSETFSSKYQDADLRKIMGSDIRQYDLLVLNFDLKPQRDNITVDFQFGSDEYEKFVGSQYVDAYGFFISGEGINGEFTNGAVNIATLPNGDRVSTNFVNHGDWGVFCKHEKNNENCKKINHNFFNTHYYQGNVQKVGKSETPRKTDRIKLFGWTKKVRSRLPVESGKTYQVKIAIANGTDSKFDSSVFIEAFRSQRKFSGTVFDHRTGVVDRNKITPFANARIHLFNDKGQVVQTTNTTKAGEYAFFVNDAGAYTVAVDAATVGPRADILPEQTWAGVGAVCADGHGGTRTLKQAGYCYGGKNAGETDRIGASPNRDKAQHIIHIPAGNADGNHLDFGFSYEVVTHAGDTGQGSLRQFIANANFRKALNMLFVPAVPQNNERGWKITLARPLTALRIPNTIIDGRARNFAQPEREALTAKNVRTGYSAGINHYPLSAFRSPDLEIASSGSGYIILLEANGQTLKNTAITSPVSVGQSIGVKVKEGVSGIQVKDNFIGVNYSGQPEKNHTLYDGIETGSRSSATITHNLIMGARLTSMNFKGSGRIEYNLILDNGTSSLTSDGISLQSSSPTETGRNVFVTKNHINGANGVALESWRFIKPERLYITDNTLSGGGRAHQSSRGEGAGLRLQARSDGGDRVKVSGNLIENNNGPGVVISNMDNASSRSARGNWIIGNQFRNNRVNGVDMPIDLSVTTVTGDGPTENTGSYEDGWPNRGIDTPVIHHAYMYDDKLVLEGGVMNEAISPVTVEFYKKTGGEYWPLFIRSENDMRTGNDAENQSSYGARYRGNDGKMLEKKRFHIELPLPDAKVKDGDQITATLVDSQRNTSEFGPVTTVVRAGKVRTSLWHDLNGNGKRDPGEPGIAGVKVELSYFDKKLSTLSVVEVLETDRDGTFNVDGVPAGEYQLNVIPGQPALSGYQLSPGGKNPAPVKVQAGQLSRVGFSYIEGTPELDFTINHRRVVIPGTAVSFQHRLVSSFDGNVVLKPEWISESDQQSVDWPIGLKQVNCNGESDGGSPISAPLDLKKGLPVCIQANSFVPANAPYGLQALMNITAEFRKSGQVSDEPPLVARVQNHLTVSDQKSDQLALKKWVENISLKEGKTTSNKAGSGDILQYTVEFTNAGATPLTQLDIIDSTPAFTTLAERIHCPQVLPDGLTGCEDVLPGKSENSVGYTGKLIWRFSGSLLPGRTGKVQYKVRVE
ncbi:choice-of-anchor L domain-containing protein [Endozoicomonas euniceicola]|uniref:Choice-of-anchor L domain-containing protein n=1 Tax=Endozoicomonas euniceicola TaxID=1234143 RepID=A0ABY6GVL8_9GAMM|nr:choice-of-anchor L domain-containing protein [Endozoicomonas euniceicola]UYM16805.1 choice-of-anchor L domain-containing protein [Endozoicomonas euniceicola]